MAAVSVIIPNYNHAVFLQQRIESVLYQTFQDFEIIILDDCSTDSSKDIIEQYRTHPKVQQIIYNTQNSGSTFLQWQKGIALSSGNFIWIAESDDWCEKTFLEELMLPLVNDDTIVLSYCQSICVNKQLNILAVGGNNNLAETIEGKEFVVAHLFGSNAVYNASMAVFRKKTVESISQEYTKLFYCGDWLFWAELALKGKVYLSGKCLNYYRKSDDDVSGKAATKGLLFTEGKKIFDFICINTAANAQSLPNIFNFRIAQYAKLYKYFENERIAAEAKQAMQSIDKNFSKHLFNYRLRNKLISLVNKYFSS